MPDQKKRDLSLGILSFSLAALFLLICSKSSPLYPTNDWVDVNCFFTVGKAIWEGVVPYRDLYEQKGPVLYFLFAISALVSDRSFFGVYLLEVVTFGLFLYFSGKLAQLYLGQSKTVWAILAVLALILVISPAFAHGGGVEEISLFTLAYGLYSVTAAMHDKRLLTFREAFLNGAFAAMVLYMKFTTLGFYIGLALFVIFWYLTAGLQWKALLATIGQFLLGVAAVSLPVWGYFLLNGAADDFFTVYFYNNLFLYPIETEGTKLELIINCLESTLRYNTSYGWAVCLGLLLLISQIRRHWRDLVMALMCFIGLAVGTYWGGRGYTYYGLILGPFAVYGLVATVRLLQLEGLTSWLNRIICESVLIPRLAFVVLTAWLLTAGWSESKNTYLMTYEKEELPAYQFAETINQVEDAKILNYGFLDGGFYHAADVTPNCRYFCTLNINTPDMWSTQRECIENGDVDFVITRRYPLHRYSPDSSAYSLVDETTFYFEGVEFTYYLYQRNPDA